MNDNNMMLENTSLFMDVDQTVSQLAEMIPHYKRSDYLLVVLCQEAMSVANQIARELGLNLSFSAVDIDTENVLPGDKVNPVDFDYGKVKESGRDIPQDFIVHQLQTLKSTLISIYEKKYDHLANKYPDKIIVMVDQLTNIDAAFFPWLTEKHIELGGNSYSDPEIRKFIFLHSSNRNSRNTFVQGLDIIIEHSFIE